MKKALAAFGVLSAALVLLVAPVSAQTPNDIKATITAAPANPVAGTSVNVTAVFSIPVLSATGAEVSVTSSAGPVTLVSFTPGLSSCLTTSGGVTCTWSTPDPASPQTIVISVPVTASGVTFNANAGAAGQATSKATTSVTVTQATTTTTIAGATTTAAATTTVAPPPTGGAHHDGRSHDHRGRNAARYRYQQQRAAHDRDPSRSFSAPCSSEPPAWSAPAADLATSLSREPGCQGRAPGL